MTEKEKWKIQSGILASHIEDDLSVIIDTTIAQMEELKHFLQSGDYYESVKKSSIWSTSSLISRYHIKLPVREKVSLDSIIVNSVVINMCTVFAIDSMLSNNNGDS